MLPPDQGGLVEQALAACRRSLEDDGVLDDPSRADALVAMAERALAGLTGVGRPAPPGEVRLAGDWVHPSGERLESHWVYFNEPASRN